MQYYEVHCNGSSLVALDKYLCGDRHHNSLHSFHIFQCCFTVFGNKSLLLAEEAFSMQWDVWSYSF